LLREADQSALGGARQVEDLSERVFRRHRRRRVTRAVSVSAVLGLVACTTAVLLQSPPTTTVQKPTRVQVDNLEVLWIDADIEKHARAADVLEAGERRRNAAGRRSPTPRSADILLTIDDERNRAALTLVSQADRLIEIPTSATDAIDIYRHVVELFPNSPAALVAARRLEQIRD
jgi:hypothetical protein